MPRDGSAALRAALALAAIACVLAPARSAPAQAPDAATLLADFGFTPAQIAQVKAGKFVTTSVAPSNERELVAGFAFLVQGTPDALVRQLRSGLVDQVDPNMLAFQLIEGAPTLASFAKLTLEPGASQRAKAYTSAAPGGPLNLSSAELASFAALGSSAATSVVEDAVRKALLARLEAYQAKGLAGLAPYAAAGGKTRSPGDELRSATRAANRLQKYAPAAYQYLLDYPAAKPAGTEETYRWSQFMGNGVPTIALTHGLAIPDGDGWVAVQRQFYVSGGYNSEQAIGALLPLPEGTLVLYTNRTSTDQVTGFGGGAKRSIGSKLLASQLETLYQRVQKKQGGS
jgi:hypothetical protein